MLAAGRTMDLRDGARKKKKKKDGARARWAN